MLYIFCTDGATNVYTLGELLHVEAAAAIESLDILSVCLCACCLISVGFDCYDVLLGENFVYFCISALAF